ncbi:hypothetical protein L2735_04845 [Shewanella olleyana]|uniref:hypothetical protein n=1 Tax=Shewanella olleyana TaxID=135626 RepID=UPI00200C26D2|nr:hypothetical protein [Shewanella olleyana]MCL1066134.1 hypothetical protein [Shewanella olleyana]
MTISKYIFAAVIGCLLGSTFIVKHTLAKDIVILNHPASENDSRYQYSFELMQLIMEQTKADFGDWEITHSEVFMTRDRVLNELISGELINVMAEAPKMGWNESLIPIKLPIRKGIQGFRVFIIKQQHYEDFQKIQTLAQLKNYPTGSGSFWSTRKAMELAGFDVVVGSSYDGLFHMLERGRFTSFGRGINEAFDELDSHTQAFPNLVLDDKVLLYIPLITIFYVSPNQPKLAKRIETGMKRIIANGQFDQVFYQQYCQLIHKTQLNKRVIFEIDNPLMKKDELLRMRQQGLMLSPTMNFDEVCQIYTD